MYQLTAYFGDTPIEYGQKPTSNLVRYRVLPDHKSPFWQAQGGRPGFANSPAKEIPAVNPASPTPEWPATSRCNLTEERQFYQADLFSLAKYGMVYDHKKMTKARRLYIANKVTNTFGDDKFICDGAGLHEGRNYLLKTNLTKGYARQESKVIASQFVYSFDYWPIVVNSKGLRMVRLHTFLINDTPPKPDLNDPRVIIAKVVRRKDGSYGEMPQLGVPLPYAFLTVGQAWYPERELERVP